MYYFDYFLLLSRIEGMPNVISESISARTKVITNNVGGCEELIIKDKTGYILSGESEIKNALEIDEIIYRNGNEKILITKKIRLFYKKFGSNIINTQIEKIYEKI
jgi:glycosyltransferase involved in cell wall biosynthesis